MPKVGTVEKAQIATEVWATTTRTLTDISEEDVLDLPLMDSGYPTVAVTSSATPDTFGSWAEISANIGAGKRLIYAVIIASTAQSFTWEMEFGQGSAGNEVVVARAHGFYATGAPMVLIIRVDVALGNNARISARVRSNNVGVVGFQAGVMVA